MRGFEGKIFFSVLFILFSVFSFSQTKYRIPYYPGEYMKYDLKVGFFNIGESEIFFKNDSIGCGAYLHASAKSTGLIKFFKDIEYTFNTCMDQETGLPRKSKRIIREGEYYNNNEVYYYHNLREDSSIVYSEQLDSVIVPKNIFDILTGFYHFRSTFLKPGKKGFPTTTITTFFIDEIWDLTLRYAGIETIETDFGKKECMKIMPITEVGQFFDTTDDMILWVTNDRHLIPVKIWVDLKVGSLNADIVEYKPSKKY